MNTAYLTQLLAVYFDEPVVTGFKLMTQGKENTTVLTETANDKLIVRLWGETHGYMGEHSDADIADEVAFMEFCYKNNIPVPQLLHSKAGNVYEKTPTGQAYAVMEYVNGETPTHFTADMVAQIATTMARMHLLAADFSFPQPRSWPGTVLDMTNDRIARFESGDFALAEIDNTLLQKAIAQYRSLLQAANLDALPSAVIHGDIMWENVKFKDGALQGIFDFGDCRESFFVEDITKSLLFAFESPAHCLFGDDGQNIAVFLQAYQNVRQLTDIEKQSLRLFFISRFLYQTLGYCAKVAKGKSEYAHQVDAVIARYKQHQAFFAQSSYGL